MKTLADWGQLLLLAAGAFGWWRETCRENNRGGCDQMPRDPRPKAEIPTEDWCPAHDSWYGPETECPGCREEWEQTWTLGEEPEEEQRRRDDWNDQAEERAAAEFDGRDDGWYLDLVQRSELGQDPNHPWRD